MTQTLNNLPAMQVQSLGWEDSLEKGMATHSNSLAWRIPWTEAPGGLQSMGGKELDVTERLTLSLAHTYETSLMVQWLGLRVFHCMGHWFDHWSGN